MRVLECVMLLSVGLALVGLTLRACAPRLRRGFTGVAVGAAVVQVVVEGTRWQLAPAYLVMIALVVLALRARAEPEGAGRRRLGVLRVAAATLAILVAVALPAVVPVPRFPAPAGPHPVGTVTFVLEDRARADAWEPGRPRRLLAQVWYPAEPGATRAPRALYLPEWRQSGPRIAGAFGLPAFFLNHLEYARSHSHESAPFAPSVGRAPLLIMSHGFRLTRTFSTTTAEALASRGYVVVGLDHTGDAAAVTFPDGSTVVSRARAPKELTEDEEEREKTSWIQVRAADVRFLIDALARQPAMPIPGVLAGHIDTDRVGVFGHSLGGGTAAEVCRSDARVVACADLDGQIYGQASASGLGQPFLLVESDGRADTFDEFAGRLRGPSCRVRGARVSHLDLCDVPLLLPIVPYLLPQPSLHNAGGADSLGAMNALLGAFFDATVRGDAASWSRVRSPHSPFSAVCERLPRW